MYIDIVSVQAPEYLRSSDEEELDDFSTDVEHGKSLWFVPVAPELEAADEGKFINRHHTLKPIL